MDPVKRLDANLLLILLLCVFAVAPLTAPGFFLKAHDATISVYFLWQFDASLRDGAWWPVWGADMVFGYGYPLFLVIAPLSYYLAEGFLALGTGMVGAIKTVYALAFLAGGLAMYLFARNKLGRSGGLVAAVAYVYMPYHLVDIYVRADLGEFTAMAFFPAILWALDRLLLAQQRPQRRLFLAVTALLYGGLILTHFTMAVIFSPVLVFFLLWQTACSFQRPTPGPVTNHSPSQERRFGRPIIAGIAGNLRRRLASCPWLPGIPLGIGAMALGVALGAAFILPVLVELPCLQARDLAGGYFSYSKHFVYFFQFFSPFWGYGYAGEGPHDDMPYQLGVVPVVLGILSLATLATPSKRRLAPQALFFQVVTILAMFAMTELSRPLWDLFKPVVAFIQFPWRLLVITSLSLAFLCGVVAAGRKWLAPILVTIVILASYPYTMPQYTDAEVSLKKMIEFQLRTGELLGDTIWVKERPKTSPLVPQYLAEEPLDKAVALSENARAVTTRYGGSSVEAQVESPTGTKVLFYTRYFPGWRGYVDGHEVTIGPTGDQGLIALEVPPGQHKVIIRYQDTPARQMGKAISGIALLGILLLGVSAYRCNKRGE